MTSFKEITKSINTDLEYFETLLNSTYDTDKELLSDVLDYTFTTKGKRVRPVLVYLSARLFAEPTERTHIAAILIELMHTASLLHDDVVDVACLRRNKPTVNSKWDNRTAILTGDFLFARAMKLVSEEKQHQLFDIITPAIMSLSVGELQQMSNKSEFNIEHCKYFEVIENKTASLISACCETGAYSVQATEHEIVNLKEFGRLVGLIFQIKDDILDYVGDKSTGKQIGIDALEQKITLPVICAWKNMNVSDKDIFTKLWSLEEKQDIDLSEIISLVIDNDGITDSYKSMDQIKLDALKILKPIKNSSAKKAMIKLIDFIIDRDR